MSNSFSNTAGNARNGQATFISNCQYGDYEYAILVRHDWHPIVCQRTRNPIGSWVTHDVYDTVIGLIEVNDSHQGISIGVDPNGIVHVIGNTHATKMRHIQTTNPHNITEWEEAPAIATVPSLGGVWDEPLSAHTIPGSMGKAQNDTNRNSGLIPATV